MRRWKTFLILVKKTNYITNSSRNRETNLLSLIKPSLAHCVTAALKANHGLIKLKRFVSRFSTKMCN
jgi:hypothetical protein